MEITLSHVKKILIEDYDPNRHMRRLFIYGHGGETVITLFQEEPVKIQRKRDE